MNSIYIETTIASLYVARTSPCLVEAARQRLTKIWWDDHRSDYELVCSQTVIDESARGDQEMSAKRVSLLSGLPRLELTDEVIAIADELVDRNVIPHKAANDAIHIAIASVHEIDYLLTWNCKHIANPHHRRRIFDCLSGYGYQAFVICTTEDLVGDENCK